MAQEKLQQMFLKTSGRCPQTQSSATNDKHNFVFMPSPSPWPFTLIALCWMLSKFKWFQVLWLKIILRNFQRQNFLEKWKCRLFPEDGNLWHWTSKGASGERTMGRIIIIRAEFQLGLRKACAGRAVEGGVSSFLTLFLAWDIVIRANAFPEDSMAWW